MGYHMICFRPFFCGLSRSICFDSMYSIFTRGLLMKAKINGNCPFSSCLMTQFLVMSSSVYTIPPVFTIYSHNPYG